MNELIKVGERTYYLAGYFQTGVYVLDDEYMLDGKRAVCLIDSCVDEKLANALDKRLEQLDYYVKLIINTHYHADHCGGNFYFQEKYNCQILAYRENAALISNYEIAPAVVWGGEAVDDLLNKYFYTKSSKAEDILDASVPNGLEIIELPGHCISMIGVKTSDDIIFIGDAVVAEETLEVQPLTYIYDIPNYLRTLEKLNYMSAKLYVPYHSKPISDIKKIALINKTNVEANINFILEICKEPKAMDEVLGVFSKKYNIDLSVYRYALIGGVVRTYITYLYNEKRLESIVENNILKWKTK